MKKYSTPKVDLLLLNPNDIVTASEIKTMSWENFIDDESGLDM